MTKDLILAIDNGTQSVRALVFDLQGNLVARSRVAIEPYFSPQPGWAEQQPDYFWDALCRACQQLWATGIPQAPRNTPDGASGSEATGGARKGQQGQPNGNERPGSRVHSPTGMDESAKGRLAKGNELRERIAGVALTCQRATVVNVDRDGKALRPAIVWLDQRRTEGLRPVGGLWGLAFRASGMRETVAYLQAEAEANWIRTHQPQLWDQTHKYLYLSGYLTYRLVGRFVDSVGCQVGYMPFDYKALHWSSRWDWKWQAVPMDRSLLPELVAPAGILGEITAQAAEATGIPAGLPLIAAAADKACEIIGTGCLDPHIGHLSYGTTATLNVISRRYVEVIPLIPPFPAAVPDAYNLETQIARGYWMVSWFKEEFAQHEQRIAQDRGIEPEELFDELVNQVPPGSMGLILQPYWSPGLKVPGPEAKGAIIGFGAVHTRAHLYRAILEGIAYGLREGLERTVRRTGVPITELRVAGGGSQSDAAMQLTADLFGLPTARPHLYESSGLGAAIDAAVGLGLHSSFEAALSQMTRTADVFEPDPQRHQIYEGLYRQVYRQMYRKLKPLYETIREITGYPAR